MRPILIFLCPIALLAAAPTDPDFNDILVEDSSANDLPFDSLALEPTPDDNTPLNVESPTASNVILAFPGEVPPPQPIPMDFASGDGVKCGNGDNLFCSRDYNANSGSINHVARYDVFEAKCRFQRNLYCCPGKRYFALFSISMKVDNCYPATKQSGVGTN